MCTRTHSFLLFFLLSCFLLYTEFSVDFSFRFLITSFILNSHTFTCAGLSVCECVHDWAMELMCVRIHICIFSMHFGIGFSFPNFLFQIFSIFFHLLLRQKRNIWRKKKTEKTVIFQFFWSKIMSKGTWEDLIDEWRSHMRTHTRIYLKLNLSDNERDRGREREKENRPQMGISDWEINSKFGGVRDNRPEILFSLQCASMHHQQPTIHTNSIKTKTKDEPNDGENKIVEILCTSPISTHSREILTKQTTKVDEETNNKNHRKIIRM